ncbi:DUF2892 domain-containing protein [Wolinella succinogenes]|uniref:Inner membrane protein YgaP-like transmembrane domain-containing protein n=1 Tax=Wolinella succinogenes (strain ATCC 29543 / DSM 1740 / CCUG 13145 / JCM 31913 / LMG 7466 / NCTC 11488 / FDC 602W) TaxID=273121 RepID=Q7MS45_WOLSU|nr:DUF2892 domain-containing protein [Wolinella succinogenes]NLU33481.1 DUF2892 domain-containing protein [Wolinella succinogenes]CAE09894.1 hypothetical protein WS0780 [Wolinella succinogenes]VEG82108.1 Protein of uncharacterised function (DUF2892) [Wolinella succinogenes]HCZ18066.1 DUF2892 domain-containing protein [Helicobacter sp.]
MKCNVGKVDKMLRIGVGVVILLAGVLAQSWWGLVGIVPLLTGLVGYCPLYSLINLNTGCKGECDS